VGSKPIGPFGNAMPRTPLLVILLLMHRSLFATVLLLLVTLASAQTTDGSKSKIAKSELAKVRKTKYRVLVPTYVPAGFVVKLGVLELDKEQALTNWTVRYVNPKTKATFTVQMASDGLGDYIFSTPDGDTTEPTGHLIGKSPIFGKFELMLVKKPKFNMTATTWIELGRKTYPNYVMIYSDKVPSATSKRIIESLRWLK